MRAIICLVLLLITSQVMAAMNIIVKGITGALQENVEARLATIDKNLVDDTPYFRRYATDETRKAVRALGYYHPEIRIYVAQHARHNSRKVASMVVEVAPGDPILINGINVELSGDGLKDPDYQQLLRTEVADVGDILNHGVYDDFKHDLQSIAMQKGYFDAELKRSRLGVADGLLEAYWDIDFNTGKRYRFGEVTFRDSVIREDYLHNIIPFQKGEYYTASQMALFNRRLSSTNWFQSVSVLPMFSHVDADKNLPIYVVTVPRKRNIFDVGLGYSTDVGVRGSVKWTKPWINSRGQSLQSNLSLSRAEQTLIASYKIPLKKSPLEQYYTIQGGFKREDNNDTQSNSVTLGVKRNWDSFTGWQKSIGINTSYDSFTQGNDSHKTFLIYPSLNFYRTRGDDTVLPMHADSQRYTLDVSSKYLGSDIDFWSLRIQQVWIRSLKDRHRFIARASFGYINTDDFERVPPSFRFFTGGDRSIRGYSYQSIAPKDSEGNLTGAASLLTGSLEYQYNISGKWWGAVFVDSGEAVSSFRNNDFHTGAGLGIRWISPVGPVKLDIATPIGERGDRSVHFYIGLGTEL